MIRISNLHKAYGSQVLFDDVSLQMGPGERLGLVGRNGHGKSTLFRLILGEEQPDSGTITFPRNYRIGHLAQHLKFTQPTILEEGILGLPEGEEWDHYKVERILSGLGFTEEDMQKPPSSFSGGFQVRLNLAKVLVSQPNLLLLDEPTNYLDIVSVRWITKFLRGWEGELIIISHDREFMDDVTTHSAAIHRADIRRVQGKTQKLYDQIALDEEIYEKNRVTEDKRRKEIELFVSRFKATASKAASVQSRIKMLEKMGEKDRLAEIQELDFRFHAAPFSAKTVMEIRNLSFYYTPDVPLIPHLDLVVQAKDRIGIIGKNGRGKSTLLNVLAGEREPVTGEIRSHPLMKLGYFGQTNIDRLKPGMTVEEEVLGANNDLGRTAARTICGIMMFSGDNAEKKVSVLSGGEKSRVMLGKILAQPANLLFLDEPTNHLDMQSIDALVEAIEIFDGAVMIVTHSEMILRAVCNKLVVFQHGEVDVFDGTYDDFLDRVGWDEEEDGKKRNKNLKSTPAAPSASLSAESKKAKCKPRAQIIDEQSKALHPLKVEMESIEKEIVKLEEDLKNANAAILEASQSKDVNRFIELSKSAKECRKKIDQEYKNLEVVTLRYDEKSKKFEELLAQAEE